MLKEVLNISLLYFHMLPVSYYSEGTGVKSKHWEGFSKAFFWNVYERTRSEHEDCYGTFKKLARNSEYSKNLVI